MKNYDNESDKRDSLKKHRILITLIGLCIVGGLAIYSVDSILNRGSLTLAELEQTEGGNESLEDSVVPDMSVSQEIPVTDSLEKSSGSAVDESTGEGAIDIMPAEGMIVKDYSGEDLVYSETLNQFVTHKAVDISTPAGTPALAVEEGTVTSVFEDDRYGLTIAIAHGDGLETRYSCLGESSVSEGDVVRKKEKIGIIGENALLEKADGPHLHFEATKDGTSVNPHEIWNW